MIKTELHIIPQECAVLEGTDPTGKLDLLFIMARDPLPGGKEWAVVSIGLDRETAKLIGERLISPRIEVVKDIASALPGNGSDPAR